MIGVLGISICAPTVQSYNTSAMAYLVVREASGRRVAALGPAAVLGRGASCDLLVNDPKASKRHAEIVERGGRFLLRDLNSRNGTLLGGKLLKGEAALQDGDEIAIGETRLVFTRSAPPGAAEPQGAEPAERRSGTETLRAESPERIRGTRGIPRGTLVVPLERFQLGPAEAAKPGALAAQDGLAKGAGTSAEAEVGSSLRSLYGLLREASSCETEDELLSMAARNLSEALPGSRVRVLFEVAAPTGNAGDREERSRSGRTLDLAVWPRTPARSGKTTTILEERMAGPRTALLTYARERGVAVLSPDVEADARVMGEKRGRTRSLEASGEARADGVHHKLSLLIAPLPMGRATLGYLVLERAYRVKTTAERAKKETAGGARDGPFSPAHLDFLAAAAYPLAPMLANVRRRNQLQRQNERLRETVEDRYRLVGDSPALQAVCAVIPRVAASNASVLISGESGTGKELVARAIHLNSKRRTGPFEALNCAALPEHLVESELFGHAKGAFTGATADRAGYFETASGGTLFLDEIAELPLPAQAKLLRVLEDSKITRVGETRLRETDCRILAATNRDLAAQVEAGAFRQDLYYRLRVMDLALPPLRERVEDLPALCAHLLAAFGNFNLDPGVLELFSRYAWPGNVRELRNTLERMAVLSRPSGTSSQIGSLDGVVTLGIADVPLDIRGALGEGTAIRRRKSTRRIEVAQTPGNSGAGPEVGGANPFTVLAGAMVPLEALQVAYARWVLEQVRGNKSKAAKVLGIQRSTLYAWTEWNKNEG